MHCDHGIDLERYCADCESDFVFGIDDWAREQRRLARIFAAIAFLAAAGIVALAWSVRHG